MARRLRYTLRRQGQAGEARLFHLQIMLITPTRAAMMRRRQQQQPEQGFFRFFPLAWPSMNSHILGGLTLFGFLGTREPKWRRSSQKRVLALICTILPSHDSTHRQCHQRSCPSLAYVQKAGCAAMIQTSIAPPHQTVPASDTAQSQQDHLAATHPVMRNASDHHSPN